jgi:hypothetical protein
MKSSYAGANNEGRYVISMYFLEKDSQTTRCCVRPIADWASHKQHATWVKAQAQSSRSNQGGGEADPSMQGKVRARAKSKRPHNHAIGHLE